MNADGDGNFDGVYKSIEWCVNNASIYNISIISMSLGTQYSIDPSSFYSSYCDANSSYLSGIIDKANSMNISVVAATGNDGLTSLVSQPACIKNVIRVGASNGDSIWPNSDRSSIVKLLAPGAGIYSTMIQNPWTGLGCVTNNIYCFLSGTSMAAPHVAGAIAIIDQLLEAEHRNETPQNIENALYNNGRIIQDSSTGNNYSRINIFSAVNSIDIPIVSFIDNIRFTNGIGLSLSCNASDWQLSNVSFFLLNSTQLVYNTTVNSSLSGGVFNFNLNNLSLGNYSWYCSANNLIGNQGFPSQNSSFQVVDFFARLDYPADNAHINKNFTFSCDAQSRNYLINTTFYLFNSTGLEYNSSINANGFYNISSFSYNFTHEGNYSWYCSFSDNISNFYSPVNYSLIYDSTSPSIDLISPLNQYISNSPVPVNFFYNASDNYNISNCSLILNGTNILTDSIFDISTNNSFLANLNYGNYYWGINCTDLAGNTGNSTTLNILINAVPAPSATPSSSGSSGGGGVISSGQINPSGNAENNIYIINLTNISYNQTNLPVSIFKNESNTSIKKDSANETSNEDLSHITAAVIGAVKDNLFDAFAAIVILLVGINIILKLHMKKIKNNQKSLA